MEDTSLRDGLESSSKVSRANFLGRWFRVGQVGFRRTYPVLLLALLAGRGSLRAYLATGVRNPR